MSTESIDELFRSAKLDIDDMLPTVQKLSFSTPLLSDDYHLLEVDAEILDKLLQSGQRGLVFRGATNEFAVLCTDCQSYQVKSAETSNTLLLTPDVVTARRLIDNDNPIVDNRRSIISLSKHYLELHKLDRIRTARLRELLEEVPYSIENVQQQLGRSIDQILSQVQMSEAELRQFLDKTTVCIINEKIYWLTFDYRANLLSTIIEQYESDKFGDSISKSALCQHLPDTPESIIDWFIGAHCIPLTNKDTYRWDTRAVCRVYAEMLLRSTKQFNYDDFFTAWTRCVPIDMDPKCEYLEGLALIDDGIRFKTIEYFPIDELPEEPQQRFDLLFKKRPKWKHNDLVPYLVDLVSSTRDIGALLTKYTRNSSINGEKLYNSRDNC